MPQVDLTDQEIDQLVSALNLWSNYIQTGSVIHSAADVAAQSAADEAGRPAYLRRLAKTKVKTLDEGQMRTIVALADLRDKLLRGGGPSAG